MSSEDDLLKKASAYSEQAYWEARYSRGDRDRLYDWFQGAYDAFFAVLLELARESRSILNIGCGDSGLSIDLSDALQSCSITNIDYATSVIDRMHARYALSHPRLSWLAMDIRSLAIRSSVFDCVVDKGTIDALFSDGSSPWSPSEGVLAAVRSTVAVVYRYYLIAATLCNNRVLAERGRFVCMSFGQPHFRRKCLEEAASWTRCHPVQPLGLYFVYAFDK